MRDSKVFILVGGKGSGKTTFCIEAAEKLGRAQFVLTWAQDPKFDIYDEIPVHELSEDLCVPGARYKIDLGSVQETNLDKVINITLKKMLELKNCTVIYDDASSVFGQSPSILMLNLLNNTRHKSVDFFFCYHSIAQIPPKILTHINYLVLFSQGVVPPNKLNWLEDAINLKVPLIEIIEHLRSVKKAGYHKIIEIA